MTTSAGHAEEETPDAAVKLTLPTLTALVVGGMVGAGVFSLPRRFAQETGVLGATLSWVIAGTGMLMLALVFQSLAVRKPALDSGVYAYAKAGFGEYLGFFSSFGYWASACFGNVTYWVLITSTIGLVAPAFGEGDTIPAAIVSSLGVWIFYILIRRGVQEAAAINRVVTVAKLVPIGVFIAICLFVLDPQVLADNVRASAIGSLGDQVRNTMLATVFVFLGVEGASVYSRHAKRREDVGRATVLGFLGVLAVFASVTIVSYGVLPYQEIAQLQQPSMAGVLESAVGPWGAWFVSIGLVISVLGAYLAWSLMSAEVLFVAAKDNDMPRFLARSVGNDVPSAALLMSTVVVQGLLVVLLFSGDAFNLAFDLTAALSLFPFLLSAAYGLKLAVTGDSYAAGERRGRDVVVAAVATVYTVFLLVAAGPKFILLSFILLAPATVLFVMARREQGRQLFTRREFVVLVVSVAGAVAGVVALATGSITL
jgi:arginine:ornithine antiporter / lysine permease